MFYPHFTVVPSTCVSCLMYVYFMNFDICTILKSEIKKRIDYCKFINLKTGGFKTSKMITDNIQCFTTYLNSFFKLICAFVANASSDL